MLATTIILGGCVGASAITACKSAMDWLVNSKKINSESKNSHLKSNGNLLPIKYIKNETHLDEEKNKINHYIKLSFLSLSLTVAGKLFFPPLLIGAASVIFYTGVPIVKAAVSSLRQGKIKAATVDSVAMVGAIYIGYILASAIACLVYFLAIRLVMETEHRSKSQLKSIFGERPRYVFLLIEGVETEVPFETLKPGDQMIIRAGESIPVDGRVLDGLMLVDERIMTGESQPVAKEAGDTVLAGTIGVEDRVTIVVEKYGADTAAGQIAEILQNTADYRSSVEAKSVRFADQFAAPTLATGGLAMVFLSPLSAVALVSCNFSEVVRVIAPIGVLNFLRRATDSGVLVKDGRALELLNAVDVVVFDKTGTLTLDQPSIGTIHVWGDLDAEQALSYAAAAQFRQSHPIARAIMKAAEQRALVLPEVETSRYEAGFGVKAVIMGEVAYVGSRRFLEKEAVDLHDDAFAAERAAHEAGRSFVFVAIDGRCVGALELCATVRPEARAVVDELKSIGMRILILSGDQERPTRQLAEDLGLDGCYAQVTPENKAHIIDALQAEGKKVCFVGDGVNDAIALKKASVSISLQGASSAAVDAADIVLLEPSLTKLPVLFTLAADLDRTTKRSIASALIPSVTGAVGVVFLGFGVYTVIGLYYAGLISGGANAMSPLWKKTSVDQDEKTVL